MALFLLRCTKTGQVAVWIMWLKSVIKTGPVVVWFICPKSANAMTGPVVVWIVWLKSVDVTTGLVVVWIMCSWSMSGPPLVDSIWSTKQLSFFVVSGVSDRMFSALSGSELGQTNFGMWAQIFYLQHKKTQRTDIK